MVLLQRTNIDVDQQQKRIRQLGDVRRSAPRLIAREGEAATVIDGRRHEKEPQARVHARGWLRVERPGAVGGGRPTWPNAQHLVNAPRKFNA
jgi:hypothetical protein